MEKEIAAIEKSGKPTPEETTPPQNKETSDGRKTDAKKKGATDAEANEADGMTKGISRTEEIITLARTGKDTVFEPGILAIDPIVQKAGYMRVSTLMEVARAREKYYRKLEKHLDPVRHATLTDILSEVSNDDRLIRELLENPAADINGLLDRNSILIIRDGEVWGYNYELYIDGRRVFKQVPKGKKIGEMTDAEILALEDGISDKKKSSVASRQRGEMWWEGFNEAAFDELGMTHLQMALARVIQDYLGRPSFRLVRGADAQKLLGKDVTFKGQKIPVGANVSVAPINRNIILVNEEDGVRVLDLAHGKEAFVKGTVNDVRASLLPEYIRRAGEKPTAPPKAAPPPTRPVYEDKSLAEIKGEADTRFAGAEGLWEAMMEAKSKGGKVTDSVKATADSNSKRSVVAYWTDGERSGWNIALYSKNFPNGELKATVFEKKMSGKTTTAAPAPAPKPPKVKPKTIAEEYAEKKKAKGAATYTQLYNQADPAPADHPYLVKKGIAPNPDIRVMPKTIGKMKKGWLMFPVRGLDGELVSIQGVDVSGKISAKGGMLWATPIHGRAEPKAHTVIVEGVATGEAARGVDARIVTTFGDHNFEMAVRQELELMGKEGAGVGDTHCGGQRERDEGAGDCQAIQAGQGCGGQGQEKPRPERCYAGK